jgi:hypothetical protein
MGLPDEPLYQVFPAWTLDKKVSGQGPGYQRIQSQTQISQMADIIKNEGLHILRIYLTCLSEAWCIN